MTILAGATLPAIFHSGEIESSKNHNIRWSAGKLTARYRLNENILIFQVFIGDKMGRSCRVGARAVRGRASPARGRRIKLFFKKFGVPVRNVDRIEKGHPFLVAGHAERFLHEWRPLRFKRSPYERHVSLLWGPAPLAAVTLVTGADNVFPGRGAILRARNHMVEIQLMPRQPPAAILTNTLIAGINVVTAETHLPLRNAIVSNQQNNPGNADYTIDQTNGLIVGGDRYIAPTVKVEGLVLFVDRPCDALIEKHKCTSHRGNMNGQIGSIENQDLGIEDAIGRGRRRITHKQLSVLLKPNGMSVFVPKYRAREPKSIQPFLTQKAPCLKSVVNSSINTTVFRDGLCGFTTD